MAKSVWLVTSDSEYVLKHREFEVVLFESSRIGHYTSELRVGSKFSIPLDTRLSKKLASAKKRAIARLKQIEKGLSALIIKAGSE